MDYSSTFTGTFEIIIGTYEEFVLGYSYKDETKVLGETFSAHSHQGSVRCITACDRYVASGGSDENIQIYDMINRKGAGTIMQHSGTVTSLKFTPENYHLISCSQDGSINIFRVGNWQLEKTWASAHRGAGVNCIDIHPSSTLALSLGDNKTLRTWNLVKGRPAYTTNLTSLGKYMDVIIWSSRGTYFAIPADKTIHIFSVESAGIVSSVQCTSRITSVTFIQDDVLCFGEEEGSIICYNITLNTELWKKRIADIRVKCMSYVFSKWLVTACSDGKIMVWQITDINCEPELLSSVNIGCRVTCMDVRVPIKVEDS